MREPHVSLQKRAGTGVAALALLFSGVIVMTTPGVASANPEPQGYTCSGGTPNSPTPIAGGDYGSVTVTGVCAVHGEVDIHGGLTIAENAGLLATDPTKPDPNNPQGPPICTHIVHLDVSGGIQVLENGLLFLGDSLRQGGGTGCPTSNDHVDGGIRGWNANSVVVHGTKIDGGFSLDDGGGGNGYSVFPFGLFCADIVFHGVDIGTPPFSDVEDSSIDGGVSISDLHTCWMGFINNHVSGDVAVNHNVLGDPDAIEIGLNTIHGGLACWGNQRDPKSHILPDDGSGGVPANTFDGSPPNPNTVTGQEKGQCAGL